MILGIKYFEDFRLRGWVYLYPGKDIGSAFRYPLHNTFLASVFHSSPARTIATGIMCT